MVRPRDRLPGLLVLVAVALVASGVGALAPMVSPLAVSILLGALVANTVGLPGIARPGVALHPLLLETGIVLLGASFPLGALLGSGLTVVALAAATVAFAVAFAELLSRGVFDLDERTGSTLAGGLAICGVSAAAAVAGAIDTDDSALAYVAGTVLLFDAVTLVLFPLVGHAVGLGAREFGIWAGLAMFSTGPVAAAGFAYGPAAGKWATLTKLVRNAFIGVVALGYAVAYGERGDASVRGFVWTRFPKFLLGFAVVAAVANAGVLTAANVDVLSRVADWLFALAFAGLGFDLDVREMRDAGVRPVVLAAVHLVVVAALAYVAVTLLA